jgi:hypothetical protein
MAKDRAAWLLLFTGLGVGIAGAIVVARHRARQGLAGRYVSGRTAQAPVIGKTTSNGMQVEHRRSNDMSIEQRVASIQDLVWKSVQLPQMRELALKITKNCPERDKACEARAIYAYVKRHVRYTGDVAAVKQGANGPLEAIDLYQRGDRTLQFGGGDCDDHTILNSSLLSLNGIPARLMVTADTRLGEWQHIYSKGLIDGKWVALDTTLPGNRFGYEVPYKRSIEFPA